MKLTVEEQRMVDGDRGEGVRKAMEILVALGEIYDADRLIPVSSVQVAGVSYKNLGEAGIEFLTEWAEMGGGVRVPTTLNPAGMDLTRWEAIGFPEDFARSQMRVIDAYGRMGIPVCCSCTPYLTGNVPALGDHVAWSESSAVSYANSAIGARTNREGGPSALAAAITGRTPRYGYHLDSNRRAGFVVEVRCPLETISDFGALGYLVGKRVENGVPYFQGVGRPGMEELKSLGAAMAASGAVALYHVEGVTPEARAGDVVDDGAPRIEIDSIEDAYEALTTADDDEVDFVSLGCPHASLEEIRRIAALVRGKRLRATTWVTTAAETRVRAARAGLVEEIETAGGRVLADTCMVVAPIEAFEFRTLATNSAKGAFYSAGHCGVNVRFGTMEDCLRAAVSGRWRP